MTLLLLLGACALYYLVVIRAPPAPPPRPPFSPSAKPFWGCGLVGNDIDADKPVWRSLVEGLKETNPSQKVWTWNWDVVPHEGQSLDDSFMFAPHAQCAGIVAGENRWSSFPDAGRSVSKGALVGNLALGANEPDQAGYCQEYEAGGTSLEACDSMLFRKDGCQQHPCKCKGQGGTCLYNVTGCGMWPLSDGACATGDRQTNPFPFQCFGAKKSKCPPGRPGEDCCEEACQQEVARNFKAFYQDMANKGYDYATTSLEAQDLQFSADLLEAAGCNHEDVLASRGRQRLWQGCPTHSAFHFYSDGCPDVSNLDASIEGFKRNVQLSKHLNSTFALDGTVVNELGSLIGQSSRECATIPAMMKQLFSYLETEEGKGVVSQMVWFNQDKVGGTYDLRLVGDDDQLTPLGEQYQDSCRSWAENGGFASAARVARSVAGGPQDSWRDSPRGVQE